MLTRIPGVVMAAVLSWPVLLSSGPAQSAGSGAGDDACIREATVTARLGEMLPENAPVDQIRQRLISRLMAEAVRQGVGAEIRSRMESASQQMNDSFSETLQDRVMEKVQGRVLSYEVTSESQAGGDDGRTLTMEIVAKVCVPDLADIPEIIAIGPVSDLDGAPMDVPRALVASAVPDHPRLILADAGPAQTYHDIRIHGRLEGARTEPVDNTRKKETLARYLAPAQLAAIPDKALRTTVTVMLTATFAGEGRALTETVQRHRDSPLDAETAPVRRALIESATEEAAAGLFEKIVNTLEEGN